MTDFDLRKTNPESLAELLNLEQREPTTWNDTELGDILAHQLRAPLDFDMRRLSADASDTLLSVMADQGISFESYADLLFHSSPPVVLLELVKLFAKTQGTETEGLLPYPVAIVVYLLTISTALARQGEFITGTDRLSLAKKLRWAMSRTWIDERSRRLLGEALEILDRQ